MSMNRQPRRHIKSGRIVKPPRTPDRYVYVDVDLCRGVRSKGAQSHIERTNDAQMQVPNVERSSGNCQDTLCASLPDTDEVADVRDWTNIYMAAIARAYSCRTSCSALVTSLHGAIVSSMMGRSVLFPSESLHPTWMSCAAK